MTTPRVARATDYTVSGCNIAAAITSANGGVGNRVLIPAGTCILSAQLPPVTQPMTIMGQGGTATIDAGSTNKTVLQIIGLPGTTVTLTNLTIKNGRNAFDPVSAGAVAAMGGGIAWSAHGGTLLIDSCTITNNTNDLGDGGGIAAYDVSASGTAKLQISNSIISANTASNGAGGGIFVGQKIDLVMSGGSVSGNKAGALATNFGQGGGLFLFGPAGSTGSSISVTSFIGNSAVDDGGAIYTTAPITFSGVIYSATNSVGANGNGPDVWNNINGTDQLSVAQNAAPIVTAGGSISFTEHDAPKAIAPGLTTGDTDDANLVGATVIITGGPISGDTLTFPPLAEIDNTETALINGQISASFNSTTFTLTLSGSATREKYQAALRTITYANNRHDLADGSRTISFAVYDGVEWSSAATTAVTVTAINDAPVLTSTPRILAAISEDDLSNAGQTVLSITGSTVATNLITDPDYIPTNDPAIGPRGIAVVAQSITGGGKWQYSLNGSTWSDFGPVTIAAAPLLRSSDYVRFLPDGLNGASASFSYRAWDQTSGTAGTMADTSVNGGTSAFSINTATVSLAVNAVNDAPAFSSDAALAAVLQATTNPPGETVLNLFGSKFVDVDNGTSLAGLAVTANSANAGTQGAWQYSTDGTNWFDIGTVNDPAALALTAASRVRFLPLITFSGAPGSLTVRAVDNSYGGSWTSGASRVTANVSANGGTTPYAAVARALSTSITPITPPTASSDAASGIALRSALLHGTVNANDSSTTVSFEYGLTTAYGSSISAIPATLSGSTSTAVSATLGSLTPGTTYHYRVVANNGITVYGSDQSFSTLVPVNRTITATAGSGGSITPTQATALDETTASFTIKPDFGYKVTIPVGGSCGGTYTGDPADSVNGISYTTNPISAECSIAASFAPTGCTTRPAGLMALWRGDGNASDSVGTYPGTEIIIGYAPGMVGPAFSLNGLNSRVTIDDHPVFQFFPFFNYTSDMDFIFLPFSISTWIRIDGTFNGIEGFGAIFDKLGNGSNNGYRLDYAPSGNTIRLLGVGQSLIGESAVAMTQGNWYHVAAVTNGAGTATIFVNGQVALSGFFSTGSGFNFSPVYPFIGECQNIGAAPFNGLIDEVQIYNSAISAADVQSLYYAAFSGVCGTFEPGAITFGTAPSVAAGTNGQVSASGGGSSSPVLFSSLTPLTCSVIDTTVSGIDTGTCIIAADQAGDANYLPASRVTQSFGILPPLTATLTVTISGSGSVTSDNGKGDNYACNSGTCGPVTFGYNDTVTLSPTGSNSAFGAWNGDLTGSANPGQITMDGNKVVAASFTPDPARVIIEGSATPYYSIGSALGTPIQDATIRALAAPVFSETYTMTNSHNLKLKGGYSDAGFTSQTGYSTISGWLKIQAGKLTVERVKIKAP